MKIKNVIQSYTNEESKDLVIYIYNQILKTNRSTHSGEENNQRETYQVNFIK